MEPGDEQEQGRHRVLAAKLNLVDLAGSERVRESGATGSRLKETQHINLTCNGHVLYSPEYHRTDGGGTVADHTAGATLLIDAAGGDNFSGVVGGVLLTNPSFLAILPRMIACT